MYEYACKIDRVVDGDTMDVTIDLGFSIQYKTRVRLVGINTPEKRTRDLEEKARGIKASAYAVQWWASQEKITIVTALDKKGKFGRVLGRLIGDDGECLNDVLVRDGHAVVYDGGKR
jgi:micrococcal nuclease|tara:strand:- start:2064 stop:2414 length:351 start_codon:yes stop_codon:yes gene_type:complete